MHAKKIVGNLGYIYNLYNNKITLVVYFFQISL